MSKIEPPEGSVTMNIPSSPEELFDLKGKVAIVLGGGQGIGEASARMLAWAGCDIIIADFDEQRAERVADHVRLLGRRASVVSGDLTDIAQVPNILRVAEDYAGGIDVLVSVVGGATWSSFLDYDFSEWRAEQARNLDYFVYCAQWVARSMIKTGRRGSICAITSIDGLQASPMHSAYGVAKAGIVSLVKSVANELGPRGIRVNAIAPGMIKTPRVLAGRLHALADKDAADLALPLRRAGYVEEIAKSVLYLSSDMASFTTGVTLVVDGGWLVTRLGDAPDSPAL